MYLKQENGRCQAICKMLKLVEDKKTKFQGSSIAISYNDGRANFLEKQALSFDIYNNILIWKNTYIFPCWFT